MSDIDTSWSVLIFGSGYVSTHLASQLAQRGATVYVTTRDPQKFEQIKHLGAIPLEFGQPLPLALRHILSTVPPIAGQDPVLLEYVEDITTRTANPHSGLRWVGYLSSTGVYGDAGGNEVTEESPTLPQSDRGQARLAAELVWQHDEFEAHIFRLAGIYGPQRNALQRIRAGKVTSLAPAGGGGPVNRVHVADIVGILLASMAKPTPQQLFNVADDLPAPTRDVTLYAAELLGRVREMRELPTINPPPEGAMGEGYRIVRNDKVKRVFGYEFRFPTYKEGLADIAKLLQKQHS